MSITKSTANTNTQSAIATIQSAEDALFITNADAAIATAIGFGQYRCTLTTLPGCNIPYLFQYYNNLGYRCYFPDVINNLEDDPSLLFGYYYTQFFQNNISALRLHNPTRMTINWK